MEAESICCAVIFLFFSLKNRYMYSRRRNTRDFQLPVNYIKKIHFHNLSNETHLVREQSTLKRRKWREFAVEIHGCRQVQIL